MLSNRLIACLVVKNDIVVQSIGFKRYLPVGRVKIAVEFLNSWGVDEIVMLDIDASPQGRSPNLQLVAEASNHGFVPLTVGGGIRTVSDMRDLLRAGADKISINRAAIDTLDLIPEGARVFGSQCIVVAIDAKATRNGWEVYTHGGRTPTGKDAVTWAQEVVERGAGELLLTSMDRDGHQGGYDLELTAAISEAVPMPVIASGGAGTLDHLHEAINIGKADAVLAASIFHYGKYRMKDAKNYLSGKGIPIRPL